MVKTQVKTTFGKGARQLDEAPNADAANDSQPAAPAAAKDDRTIYVQNINADTAHTIVRRLLELDEADPSQPITMIIHSGGGFISAGRGIIGVMKSLRAPLHTVAFGDCESMASHLLAAGDRGHRKIYAGTRVMIHQPSLSADFGRESNGAATAVDMANSRRRSERIYLHCLGLPPTKKFLNLMSDALETDTVLNATQACALGLADEVIDAPPDSAFDGVNTPERKATRAERGSFLKMLGDVDRLEDSEIDMASRKQSELGQRAVKILTQERARYLSRPRSATPGAAPA